jgi:hypothetical protein
MNQAMARPIPAADLNIMVSTTVLQRPTDTLR